MAIAQAGKAAGIHRTVLPPRIHAAGVGALLLDAAGSGFDAEVQRRIVAMAARLGKPGVLTGIKETVPGVNNILVTFDPLALHPAEARRRLGMIWQQSKATNRKGRERIIPVTYDVTNGSDLGMIAAAAGLTVDEVIRRHSEAEYAVACIGSMAGFAYLTGLPAELAIARRATPRMKIAVGSVIIGGVQAGVMPCDAPSGWHILGVSDVRMFDASRDSPCWLALGDRVKFQVKEIRS